MKVRDLGAERERARDHQLCAFYCMDALWEEMEEGNKKEGGKVKGARLKELKEDARAEEEILFKDAVDVSN